MTKKTSSPLSHRSLLMGLSMSFLSLLGWDGSMEAAPDQAKKNVLFIAVDDLNDWVGVYKGHPQAKTPNLDRLAKAQGGLVFDNAHCPASVCGPSRSALLSGVRPSNSGVYGNKNNMKLAPKLSNNLTISEYFMKHGYYALSTGKIFHKHPNWTGMDQGQWAYHEWQYSQGSNGFTKQHKMKMPLNQMPMLDGSAPKGLDKEFDWGPTVAPLEQTKDHVSAKWAADQLLNKDFGGQPFFMALGISKPHLAWYVPQEFFDMHPLEDVIVPEIHEDDLDDILNKYGKKKFKPNVDFLRVQKYNKFKEVTQAYLAAVSYADACIGVALDALEKSPHRDNTIVAIWGDHGWFLGEKMRYGKTNLWEESTRVPLIMKVPRRVESGTHTKGIVNLIDLYPTLAELCGLPSNPDIDGKSFAALVKNPEKPWEEPTLTTIGFKNHSLRGPRYRFSQYIDGTEELYDELKDPNERTNLINSPEHASVIESYRAMMPKHNEPEMTRNEIDKKRLGRALDTLKKQSRELRQMYYDNTMDPELVKATYRKTK